MFTTVFLTMTVVALAGAAYWILLLISKNKSLESILKYAWDNQKLIQRQALINIAPERVRYLTAEEAARHYTFDCSFGGFDDGPGAGLYIINPTEDELSKIKKLSAVCGKMITWPLSKAPYYFIPGEMTEEDKRLFYYNGVPFAA